MNCSLQSFLRNHQEKQNGRVAVATDPDFERISTMAGNLCGLTPNTLDTDGDGLPDGRVNFGSVGSPVWKGEDLNNNGVRDQDASGEWNETDFLANDSDVDGVLDGAEVNGTYCFKAGTVAGDPCANTGHPLDPLVADFDGDGLRDGQELAGWTVGGRG